MLTLSWIFMQKTITDAGTQGPALASAPLS